MSIEIYMSRRGLALGGPEKAGGQQLPITDEDIKKGYEANYGPRARCRAIILNNQRKAQEVWEKARDNPTAEYFAKLAKEYSIDSASSSAAAAKSRPSPSQPANRCWNKKPFSSKRAKCRA